MGVHIQRHLKEEQAEAIDKWLVVVSNNNVILNSYGTRKLNKAIFNFKTILYVLLCGPQ